MKDFVQHVGPGRVLCGIHSRMGLIGVMIVEMQLLMRMMQLEKMTKECYIVGGGTSIEGFDWSLLEGKFVIALNRALENLPKADIVFFIDKRFWNEYKLKIIAHKGKLIKASRPGSRIDHDMVEEYTLHELLGLYKGSKGINYGWNTGYAAINLAAVHLGFNKIYLLGFDMKSIVVNNKKKTHFHDGYPAKWRHNERAYHFMLQRFDTIVEPLKEMGIEVININEGSNLKCFPTISFKEAFK